VPQPKAPPAAGKPGFCIWIVSPAGYLHSRCFEETALALSEAFGELGYGAPIVTDPAAVEGTAVVLGTNLLRYVPRPLPEKLILYNLEQVQVDSPWFDQAYIELLRHYSVWDYSSRNIHALAGLGVKAVQCGIGYSPGLTRIPHSLVQDIDVAFIGSIGERRARVLEALERQGMKVFAGSGLYGAERDAIFGRAKVVLNLHHYEAQVFEIVRVSYLLANRLCIVSEAGLDNELEAPFRHGVAFVYYRDLVAVCHHLMQRPEERRRLSDAGFEAFKARPQAPMLEAALAAVPQMSRS
jgi:hypothetical protein